MSVEVRFTSFLTKLVDGKKFLNYNPGKLSEILEKIAETTLRKNRRITIRLYDHDYKGIQKKAMKKGILYQTLISGMVHHNIHI